MSSAQRKPFVQYPAENEHIQKNHHCDDLNVVRFISICFSGINLKEAFQEFVKKSMRGQSKISKKASWVGDKNDFESWQQWGFSASSPPVRDFPVETWSSIKYHFGESANYLLQMRVSNTLSRKGSYEKGNDFCRWGLFLTFLHCVKYEWSFDTWLAIWGSPG